jgi:hypothetical protein
MTMHLRAKRPIFVPHEYRDEIEKLSKAALMDMVWDFAAGQASDEQPSTIMAQFRARWAIVKAHRDQA